MYKFRQQSGAVLIASMMILLLLTLIGVTGTQVTSLEEKMASNYKDQNVSFQTTEVGLRGGELEIEVITSADAFDGNNGLLSDTDTYPDIADANTWTANNSREYDFSVDSITSKPRYFIKYIRKSIGNSGSGVNVGGYNDDFNNEDVYYFTVTAKGTGKQDSSQVYLRSHYGKRF